MHRADAVVECEGRVAVVVVRAGVLVRLLAAGVHHLFLTEPVVFVTGGVDVEGGIAVVVGREYDIEARREEVALAVFERRHERVSPAVFLAEDGLLAHARLYLLVHVGVGETDEQSVGPGFVFDADFRHDGFVVVGVVKPLHTLGLLGIEVGGAVVLEIFYRGVDPVVVVGVVLECREFIDEAVVEPLPEVDVRLVGVERAVGVGGIDMPAPALAVGDDVDDSPQGIGAEPYRHYPFINFDAVGKVDGNVVQPERAAHPLLRYAVDEYLDVFPAEPVERDGGARPHAARFAHLHAGYFGQRAGQVAGRVVQPLGVDGHGVVGRAVDAAHPVGAGHGNFAQRFDFGLDDDVEFYPLSIDDFDLPLYCLVAECGDNQRVFPDRRFDAENPLFVGLAATARAFEVGGGKGDGFVAAGDDAPREHSFYFAENRCGG